MSEVIASAGVHQPCLCGSDEGAAFLRPVAGAVVEEVPIGAGAAEVSVWITC